MAVRVIADELQPGLKVVALSGRLDMESSEADTPVIRRALDASALGIVIHLGAVDFVSSSGFRMLLATYQAARNAGKVMILTRPRPSVYKIFKVAALDTKLPFCEEHEVAPIEAHCQQPECAESAT